MEGGLRGLSLESGGPERDWTGGVGRPCMVGHIGTSVYSGEKVLVFGTKGVSWV